MPDEFLTDEFFLRLIRLGVHDVKVRNAVRQILQRLHKIRSQR